MARKLRSPITGKPVTVTSNREVEKAAAETLKAALVRQAPTISYYESHPEELARMRRRKEEPSEEDPVTKRLEYIKPLAWLGENYPRRGGTPINFSEPRARQEQKLRQWRGDALWSAFYALKGKVPGEKLLTELQRLEKVHYDAEQQPLFTRVTGEEAVQREVQLLFASF